MLTVGNTYAREIVMRLAPASASRYERELDSADVVKLNCFEATRKSIVARPGIILDSEKITRSKTFGYIYRYDLVNVFEDENGEPFTARQVLVFWTKNCKTVGLATYPTFELPNYSSK